MLKRLIAVTLILPGAALAVSSDINLPPKPTETTTHCTGGTVWDHEAGECVEPEQNSRLDADTLYEAARELAYAGRHADALRILAAMPDPGADRVLTYMGFVHRRMGEVELGMAYYRQALAKNPDNLLARSYMGQGFVEAGDLQAARLQLAEIRMRGGTGGWPEKALRLAIETGRAPSY